MTNTKPLICTVFDTVSGIYSAPFLAHNEGVAKRAFSLEIMKPDSIFTGAPADYQLYSLGTFCDSTGVIELTKPSLLLPGSSLRRFNDDSDPDAQLRARRKVDEHIPTYDSPLDAESFN